MTALLLDNVQVHSQFCVPQTYITQCIIDQKSHMLHSTVLIGLLKPWHMVQRVSVLPTPHPRLCLYFSE